MKKLVAYSMGWSAAVALATGMAFVAPSESSVMGRLPDATVKPLQQPIVLLTEALPADRTLALVNFSRAQRPEVESWIHGLGLKDDSSIAWVRMPVVNDPGDERSRAAVERKLLERYPSAWERSRMVTVFTDREAFVRSAGLSGTNSAYALVIGRNGEVLARAEGVFDQDKAAALRETLLARAD